MFIENNNNKKNTKYGKKTLVIGAGNTGDMVIRDIRKRGGYSDYYPVGILDDNKEKIGTYMHGLKVLGATEELPVFVSMYGVEAIIIAIPSLNHKTLRKIHDSARKLHVGEIKIVPRIYDVNNPDINTKHLEDIKIEDLLGRQSIEIDYKEIKHFLNNKIILITGAGGSIGSEITLQVCSFNPHMLVLFDIDETELHNIKLRLIKTFPCLFKEQISHSQIQGRSVLITGDIRDEDLVTGVFRRFKPQIVFHAAAYKHVPMMEINSKEAVKVNMFGTYNVVKASADFHAEKFVLISTDKAVSPTSIMGATKRMAEYICTAFNSSADTSFMSVRFGNVLGSRGSVLPAFLEQLKQGGPLTVTHRDMQRYFMTIPEAVSLVLQSSVIGKGGDVLVLDMGEPVKILTLAEELIRIHRLQPYKDIDIEFTGLRPGEKLFEELLTAEEGSTASKHEKIFIANNSEGYSRNEIEKILNGFEKLLKALPVMEEYEIIRDTLKRYVKSMERRQTRENQQPTPLPDTAFLQAEETNFQNYRLQFEKLLQMLPAIEDSKLIQDTLNNYVKSLHVRRNKRRIQKLTHGFPLSDPRLQEDKLTTAEAGF